MTEITAKIANVLDSTRVAVTAGEEDGVQVGDAVRLWREVEVVDPDSQDSLGSVRLSKGRLSVTQVQPRFCVAQVEAENWSTSLLSPRRMTLTTERSPRSATSNSAIRVEVGELVTIEIDNGVEE